MFIPAALLCARVFYPNRLAAQRAMLAAMLLQPAAILIDHGHFQYNNISLGLIVRSLTREYDSPLALHVQGGCAPAWQASSAVASF